MPPHTAVLALASAANGDYPRAAQLQRQVIERMAWMPGSAVPQPLREALDAYENQRLPQQPAWPQDDPLLMPPPPNPVAPFTHYPAPVPY